MASYHLSIKSGKKGSAAAHAAYIGREGKYHKCDDLIATGFGNLPAWSANDPMKFWRMADKYERQNAAAYREYVLALPNELPETEQVLLVETFIEGIVPDKTFHFAIHRPEAALGRCPQPHAHIMVSDRLPEDVDRPPSRYFRRFNPDSRELGGCRKDSGGKNRTELSHQVRRERELWARLQNDFLELNGFDVRVDHRSHRERGIDALPGTHLGQAKIRQMLEDVRQA